MPTLIDSLIVELGLDPSQFDKEAKGISARLTRFKRATEQTAKQSEEHIKGIADAFDGMTKKILGYVGSFLTARAALRFASGTIETTRNLGNLADSMQIGIQKLSALGNAFDRLGGNSENVYATIDKWNSELQAIEMGAGNPQTSQLINFLKYLGLRDINIDPFAAPGRFKDTADIFVEVAEKIGKSNLDERTKALLLSPQASGIDRTTASVMLRGGEAMRKHIEDQKKIFATTEEQRKNIDKLREKWVTLGQTAKNLGQEILSSLSGDLGNLLDVTKQFVSWLTKMFTDQKGIFFLPSLEKIKTFFFGGPGRPFEGGKEGKAGLGWPRTVDSAGKSAPATPGNPNRTGVEDTSQPFSNIFEGKPKPSRTDLVTVDTPYGKIAAHPEAAEDFRNFYSFLHKHGAPIKNLGSYSDRAKRFGSGTSMHAYGIANDMDNQQFLSPEMQKWIKENPTLWRQALRENRMYWGGDWKSVYDPGHIQWGRRPETKEAKAAGGGWGAPLTAVPFLNFNPIMLRKPNVSNTTKTQIGNVTVNSNATDAAGMAGDIVSELRRQVTEDAMQGQTP